MRFSRLDDSDFMGMMAATIHSRNPQFTIHDSIQTAFDLQAAVEKRIDEERAKREAPKEASQQRQA